MYRIGGLELAEKPCECNAPFAETGANVDGTLHVTLWLPDEKGEHSQCLFSERHDDNDDLNMVCTRCGWHL